jgi:hypothetical protein
VNGGKRHAEKEYPALIEGAGTADKRERGAWNSKISRKGSGNA